MPLNGKRNMAALFTTRLKNWAAVLTGTGTTFTMDDHYYKAVIKVFVDYV